MLAQPLLEWPGEVCVVAWVLWPGIPGFVGDGCALPVAVFPYSLSVNPSQGFPHGTVDELQSCPSATHLHVATSSLMRGAEAGGSPFPCKCGSPDKTDAGS